jgi:acetylornithine deacetylase/succinyl-diaminopimelate desuccinylase-like protein
MSSPETAPEAIGFGPKPDASYNGASTMNPRVLEHLRRLVRFYPVTSDQDSVHDALEYCQGVLLDTGSFKDADIIKVDSEKGPVYSLFASTQGTKNPRLLLSGHIDVVPVADDSQKELVIEDGYAKGRGTLDMLFAAACYLDLAETHQDELDDLDLGVLLAGDEEAAGHNSTEPLLKQGYGVKSKVCILPDGGHDFGYLDFAANGFYFFDIKIGGTPHHGSIKGDGAGNKMADLLAGIRRRVRNPLRFYGANMTITSLDSGDGKTINVAPSWTEAGFDIRTKRSKDQARVEKMIRRRCAKEKYQGTIVTKEQHAGYRLDKRNPEVRAFLKLYRQSAGNVKCVKSAGSSDARFFYEYGVPSLVFRPDGTSTHSPDEAVSLQSLDKFYKLLEEYTLQTARME